LFNILEKGEVKKNIGMPFSNETGGYVNIYRLLLEKLKEVDITKHILVPKHRILSEEDKEEVKKKALISFNTEPDGMVEHDE